MSTKRPEAALFYAGQNKEGGKFLLSPIVKNMVYAVSKEVAQVLEKRDPEMYTGHCRRQSSTATAAADNRATTMDLRKHFHWAKDSMCKEYVDRSKVTPRKVAAMLQGTTSDTTGEEDAANSAEDWCDFTPEDIHALAEEFTQAMEEALPTQVAANNSTSGVCLVYKESILIIVAIQVLFLIFV